MFQPKVCIPTSWDIYYLNLAQTVANKSKDDYTKCGCVLVRNNGIISTGYNGLPSGTDLYDDPAVQSRPEKYFWFEHSERNAIYIAAKNGVSTDGATAYITGPPCIDCTRALIQSGIVKIVIPELHNMRNAKWANEAWRAELMMRNANICYEAAKGLYHE